MQTDTRVRIDRQRKNSERKFRNMKKTAKTEVRVFNDEYMGNYGDRELDNVLVQLRHDREACASKGKDTKPIEIEICYILRELEFRNFDRLVQSYERQRNATFNRPNQSQQTVTN